MAWVMPKHVFKKLFPVFKISNCKEKNKWGNVISNLWKSSHEFCLLIVKTDNFNSGDQLKYCDLLTKQSKQIHCVQM